MRHLSGTGIQSEGLALGWGEGSRGYGVTTGKTQAPVERSAGPPRDPSLALALHTVTALDDVQKGIAPNADIILNALNT